MTLEERVKAINKALTSKFEELWWKADSEEELEALIIKTLKPVLGRVNKADIATALLIGTLSWEGDCYMGPIPPRKWWFEIAKVFGATYDPKLHDKGEYPFIHDGE